MHHIKNLDLKMDFIVMIIEYMYLKLNLMIKGGVRHSHSKRKILKEKGGKGNLYSSFSTKNIKLYSLPVLTLS